MGDIQLFPFAQSVVALAADQIGLHELGGPNLGPPIDKFAGGRSEPWCAHFVAWLYRECGIKIPGDVRPTTNQHNPIARVATMLACCEEAGWAQDQPSVGAIIFFDRRIGSDKGAGMHCGIVSTFDGHLVQTIEGNSGDSVARRGYTTGNTTIKGYAFPSLSWPLPRGCRLT